jgi:hypothetical protein
LPNYGVFNSLFKLAHSKAIAVVVPRALSRGERAERLKQPGHRHGVGE